ncbi:hypothetical protein [Desertivirga xinjiangensis]|uniref:hypothetical protein n=1 Tax=Desertivirga xinjiangensis TaxID=539206 RepID=UPI00210BD30F|nr:hypothetical protein [Pedobacter xinjiangensis]
MKLSSIEITENEYLIKLNKDEFDLSLINTLLKRIQAENFFSFQREDDEDLISRNRERTSYFGHLDDK